jgi:predicted membrane protein
MIDTIVLITFIIFIIFIFNGYHHQKKRERDAEQEKLDNANLEDINNK